MSITYYGQTSVVSESCVWVAERDIRLCITYEYQVGKGVLTYAESAFICDSVEGHLCDIYEGDTISTIMIEPTIEEMTENEVLTTNMFKTRPVCIQIAPNLEYGDIINAIIEDYTVSTVYPTNDQPIEEALSPDFNKIIQTKAKKLRYISDNTTENYFGKQTEICREFFIAYKSNTETGDLLYGATISRRPTYMGIMDDELRDAHYKTALARLDKCPVYIQISEENRPQLLKNAPHREDIMYEIMDYIETRYNGNYRIKEDNRHTQSFSQIY